jgi:hypothetical protein
MRVVPGHIWRNWVQRDLRCVRACNIRSPGIRRRRLVKRDHPRPGWPFHRYGSFPPHLPPTGISRRSRAGDIRSRLVRLIPPAPSGTPLDALRTLLAHRLPSGNDAERAARDEWRSIVEGRSSLWAGIPEDRKETIRGTQQRAPSCSHCISNLRRFSCIFRGRDFTSRPQELFVCEWQVRDDCTRSRYSWLTTDFTVSIGNFLLAAAQAFFRSLPSAIFLFSSITNSQVWEPSFSYLPYFTSSGSRQTSYR